MTDGYVGHWDGEDWVYFHWAASEISDKLDIRPRSAKAQLRKLCASGEIRAISSDESDLLEEPEPIPPSRWRDEDIAASWRLLIAVSRNDLRNWLSHQSISAEGGKQSRITRLLAEMYPTGVPNRGDCPRQHLTAELIKRDPSLTPLDPKTLRTAIKAYNRQAYNRQQGNARNTTVSD
jgi:hypothetical protein